MTVRVLPDSEALAIAYLRTVPEVVAIIGEQIGTSLDLTEDTALPALRLTRVSTRLVVPRHFRTASVQLEAFALTELAAQDLCELAWAALFEPEFVGVILDSEADPLGVVTGVSDSLGPRRLPDPDTDTPRWLAVVQIHAHPAPA